MALDSADLGHPARKPGLIRFVRISKDILGYTCIYMDNIEIGPIGNLNWDIPTKPRLSVTDKTWGLGQSWATNKTQSAGHLPHESIQFCG